MNNASSWTRNHSGAFLKGERLAVYQTINGDWRVVPNRHVRFPFSGTVGSFTTAAAAMAAAEAL